MNTIVNKTNYDNDFYKTIANYKLTKDFISIFGAIGIILCCYSGVTSLVNGKYETSTYIYLVLGLILIPITCFVLPYRNNCKAYDKAMKLTKGKPFIVEVKFSLDSFNMKNSLSQSELHKYSEVKSINVRGNLIIINLKQGNTIYIDSESFIDGAYKDFKVFINKNSGIKFDE